MGGVSLLVLACVFVAQTLAQSKPHIVFLLLDDLGYNDVGWHNHFNDVLTPALDSLARNGTILEHFYTQPICTPTRAALMTGRYPIRNGMQHLTIANSSPWGLPLNETLLSDKLKSLGYATAIVGKWHLGFFKEEYLPLKRGFDQQVGYYGGNENYFFHHAPFDAVKVGLDWHRNETEEGVVESDVGVYSAFLYSKGAVDVIMNHDANRGPLFLYVPFQAVHSPLNDVPPSYCMNPVQFVTNSSRRLNAAHLWCADDVVRNITKALEAKGMLDDTVIVFQSDNGAEHFYSGGGGNYGSNYPLRGIKRQMFEGGVRVASFIFGGKNFRKIIPAGEIRGGLFHVTDWLPTLVTLAGGDPQKGSLPLDGLNQLPFLSENKTVRTEIFHNYDPELMGSDIPTQAAVRVGDWKLIQFYNKTLMLFNVIDDQTESVDLAAKMPDKVKELNATMQKYISEAVPINNKPAELHQTPKIWKPWH